MGFGHCNDLIWILYDMYSQYDLKINSMIRVTKKKIYHRRKRTRNQKCQALHQISWSINQSTLLPLSNVRLVVAVWTHILRSPYLTLDIKVKGWENVSVKSR